MTRQQTFFDDEIRRDDEIKRMSRRADPATSHEAAAELVHSGAADSQRRECLAAVQKSPGRTAVELAHEFGIDRYAMSRRLPDRILIHHETHGPIEGP